MRLKWTDKHRGTDPHTKSLSGRIFKFSKQFDSILQIKQNINQTTEKKKENCFTLVCMDTVTDAFNLSTAGKKGIGQKQVDL